MTKRRTRISIETHRLLVISGRHKPARRWCETCSAPVEMLTPEEAGVAAQVDSQLIHQWLEANGVHFTQVPGGILICLNSLLPMVGADGGFGGQVNGGQVHG